MLFQLHETLQHLLYERGQISPREVDISFEAPTREHVESLTRPAINLFLLDMQENLEMRQSAFKTREQNGRVERRQAPRRFDVHYMITMLSTNVEDEHLLLWRVLATLLQYPQLPEEALPEELRSLDTPLSTRIVSPDEGQGQSGIWSALGIPPHPALHYVVTVPVEMDRVITAPLVLTRTIRYRWKDRPEVAPQVRTKIGGRVLDGEGRPLKDVVVSIEGRSSPESTTNEEGRFVLHNVSPGPVTLHVERQTGTQKTVVIQVAEEDTTEHTDDQFSTLYSIVLEAASATEA